jgi:hypothetical protein
MPSRNRRGKEGSDAGRNGRKGRDVSAETSTPTAPSRSLAHPGIRDEVRSQASGILAELDSPLWQVVPRRMDGLQRAYRGINAFQELLRSRKLQAMATLARKPYPRRLIVEKSLAVTAEGLASAHAGDEPDGIRSDHAPHYWEAVALEIFAQRAGGIGKDNRMPSIGEYLENRIEGAVAGLASSTPNGKDNDTLYR